MSREKISQCPNCGGEELFKSAYGNSVFAHIGDCMTIQLRVPDKPKHQQRP